MPKHSDIVQQTIDRSIQISKDMRKAYEKEMKAKAKLPKVKSPSVVQEFIKEHQKELTPAEKGKLTKEKKKAKAQAAEKLKLKQTATEAFLQKKALQTKRMKEALAVGRSPSDL